MMQLIREEQHVQDTNFKPQTKPKANSKSKAKSKNKSKSKGNKARNKSSSSSYSGSVHFNLQIDASPNMHSTQLSKEELQQKLLRRRQQSHQSTFDSVDMNISAPMGLLSYFGDMDAPPNNGNAAGKKQQQQYMATLSPPVSSSPGTGNKHVHFPGQTRLSLLRAHSQENSSMLNSSMLASYSKLKLLHRCVTLRRKTGNHAHANSKKSIVLDLAQFGMFLKEEKITQQHPWFDAVWNKYDKLFRLKIDFYFVSELLSDVLNEYLMHEYDTNIEQIMSVDIKRTIQQIIVHIRPYHLEKHNSALSPLPYDYEMIDEEADNDDIESELPFTFADFQSLGDWLYEIEEMEEEEEDEDYFMMDIHYYDFVQYVMSHTGHVWKKVIQPLVAHKQKQKRKSNAGIDIKRMEQVLQKVLVDYGRNGLGNVNMEIYSTQIKEYANHLSKLFHEYRQQNSNANASPTDPLVTQQQFFEFVRAVPQL